MGIIKKIIYLNFILLLNISLYNFKSIAQESFKNKDGLLSSELKGIKSEYLLGPGDELFIDFKGLEIFTKNYSVNPEGFLNLPEIQLFYVSGKTISEVTKELITAYQTSIINPEIRVIVSGYKPVSFTLSGEVRRPGIYKLSYKNDSLSNSVPFDLETQFKFDFYKSNKNFQGFTPPKLSEAIKEGSGFTSNANLKEIIITRKNSITQGGGRIKTSVDILKLLQEGDLDQDVVINDGDHIYIPKTNQKIKDQLALINRSNLTPNTLTVFINGNIGRTGQILLPQGASLNEGIAAAGGRESLSGNIVFIRLNNSGKTDKRIINYSVNAKKGSRRNPILYNNDIIFIKQNLLGKTTSLLREFSAPIISSYGLYNLIND